MSKNYKCGNFTFDAKTRTMKIGENGPYSFVGILILPQEENNLQVFGDYEDALTTDLAGFRDVFGDILTQKDFEKLHKLAKEDKLVGISCNFNDRGEFQAGIVEPEKEDVSKHFSTIQDAIKDLRERALVDEGMSR